MDDISIILETTHEFFLLGLKNKYFTFFASILLTLKIVYFKNILDYMNDKYTKNINNCFNNKLFRLLYIGVIVYIYKYNRILSILLLLFYLLHVSIHNDFNYTDNRKFHNVL